MMLIAPKRMLRLLAGFLKGSCLYFSVTVITYSKYGVRGYPTIKYFTSSTDPMGDAYEGGRTFDDLKKFATEVSLLNEAFIGNDDNSLTEPWPKLWS